MEKIQFPKNIFDEWRPTINRLFPKFFDDTDPDTKSLARSIFGSESDHGKLFYLRKNNKNDRSIPRVVKPIKSLLNLITDFLEESANTLNKYVQAIEELKKKADNCNESDHESWKGIEDKRIKLLLKGDSIAYRDNMIGYFAQNDSSLFGSIEFMLDQFHDFNSAGRVVFSLENELMDELIATDSKRVTGNFFRLPFPSMMIHVPKNDHLKILGSRITEIYISEFPDNTGSEVFIMYRTEGTPPAFFELRIDNDKRIGDQVRSQVITRYSSTKFAIQENLNAMKFITSVILYMNTGEKEERSVRGLVRDEERDQAGTICMLGRPIDTSKGASGNTEPRNIFSVNVLKWAVRGHFRNQAYGDERKDRRIIWIRPFLKGRERELMTTPCKPSKYRITKQTRSTDRSE